MRSFWPIERESLTEDLGLKPSLAQGGLCSHGSAQRILATDQRHTCAGGPTREMTALYSRIDALLVEPNFFVDAVEGQISEVPREWPAQALHSEGVQSQERIERQKVVPLPRKVRLLSRLRIACRSRTSCDLDQALQQLATLLFARSVFPWHMLS